MVDDAGFQENNYGFVEDWHSSGGLIRFDITDHAVKENHVIDWERVKVIEREKDRQTRLIKEAL